MSEYKNCSQDQGGSNFCEPEFGPEIEKNPQEILFSDYGFEEADDPTGLSRDLASVRIDQYRDTVKKVDSTVNQLDLIEEPEVLFSDYGFEEADDPTGGSSDLVSDMHSRTSLNRKRKYHRRSHVVDFSQNGGDANPDGGKREEYDDEFWEKVDKLVDEGVACTAGAIEIVKTKMHQRKQLGANALRFAAVDTVLDKSNVNVAKKEVVSPLQKDLENFNLGSDNPFVEGFAKLHGLTYEQAVDSLGLRKYHK